MPKGRRVNSSGEKSKKLLLEKAMELFSTYGYHETKISDIVKSANLTQPTFYLYFQSKESLYKDLNEEFQTNFFQLVQEDLDESTMVNDSLISNIEHLLVNVFTYFAENPYLTKIGFYDSEDSVELKKKFSEQVSKSLHEQKQAISSNVESLIVADSIVGAIERLTLTALLPKLREPKQLANDIVNIYFTNQQELVR
ncbi:TetR family transcriptional regulator [Ureibacillus xyleni]|uniref:TetR family transcriptional regulator n=1 Tax=Ureibacillus xyleni TaxID=614648 RepID=A0A285RA15_9BACL|nr:TetR/AcrR family transcriptional regulator [Ureibacillus xyleni]SOB90901.1 TetR family transcriptional regulator [Ureibacillus xyleni]